MSMLKGKVGFVIPKNKFSGSLVPIFKKSEIKDTASEDLNKQQQRKTRWGADLTQDTSVKRDRALAYQTRVDQITEQLKLGQTRSDYQNSNSAGDAPNELAATQNFQSLELERRECIGEILKLNPGYKIPSYYEPVLREATVPIPVKAHPEYNFLVLVYGSDGETQKRLEKETGTRIQVYGTVTKTGEKVEIIPSDGSEALRVYEEAHVRISADTYEKVDAAANIIELLLNSVSVKPADSKTLASVPEDGQESQDTTTTANTSVISQEIIPPVMGSISFQQYPNTWFPAGQFSSLSGVTPNPNSDPLSMQHPSFSPGRPAPHFFGSAPQSTSIIPPRLHSQAPQGIVSEYHVGHTGPPRNFSDQSSPSSLVGHQLSYPRVAAHQLSERSPGWSTHAPPSQYPSPQERPSGTSFMSSQIRSSSSVQFQSFTPHNQLNSSRPPQFPVPRPNFNHFNSAGPTIPGPPLRGSNDFTFNPRLPQGPPSQSLPGQSVHFSSQRPSQTQFPPVPQMPSFRPALQSTNQQPVRQSFPRQAGGNQMGPPSPVQFGAPNLNPHLGLRNHSPAPLFPGAAGSLLYRGPVSQFQQIQSRAGGVFGGNQLSRPSGRPQVYDPFLPSSLPAGQPQGIARKQESDPEYEDLMASVGVK